MVVRQAAVAATVDSAVAVEARPAPLTAMGAVGAPAAAQTTGFIQSNFIKILSKFLNLESVLI